MESSYLHSPSSIHPCEYSTSMPVTVTLAIQRALAREPRGCESARTRSHSLARSATIAGQSIHTLIKPALQLCHGSNAFFMLAAPRPSSCSTSLTTCNLRLQQVLSASIAHLPLLPLQQFASRAPG
ncbi:unnamed protein product [Periconia digitata]|uniref:Uncharacterized protein n=1 Tax=Periconia digitata TaxID=1303443 RepID=A0A9W4ULE4_9PLEO|nr:unnamed protein product [Periconia digitata]